MLVFISLFLGLVTGPKSVELGVAGKVAAVEIRLDGESLGVLREPPWELEVDFGPRLMTRKLVAIARDPRGVPLDVVTQLVNVPRSPVESELLLEDWQHGVPGSGRLIWHSVDPMAATELRLNLDGQKAEISDDGRFKLPSLDERTLHFLSAEVHFPNGWLSTAEAVFGGVFGSSVRTDLTAVPLFLEGEAPLLEDVTGWLTTEDEVLPIVAFEQGAAELVVVRDEAARLRLVELDDKLYGSLGLDSYRFVNLDASDSVRLVSSMAKHASGEHPDYVLFPQSHPWPTTEIPLPGMFSRLKLDDPGSEPQLLIDAVAVAGRAAAASQKRRAVVLLVADCAAVEGARSVESVRAYLSELQVPLRVWMVEPVPKNVTNVGFCAQVEDVSSGRRLLRAIKVLRRDLERQRIAWVEGRHLPQAIELSELATGARLRE